MRHHVVAHLVLALFGDLVVDVGDVRSELVDLLLRVRSKKRLGLSHLSELSLKRLYVVHNCGSSVFR